MVFMKPESALKRADELIEVGKKQRALETLLEVVKSRRHRTWTKTHEPLMEKLLELCVELKKSQIAKDGLHQYKTISQTVSVKSLEDVIMKYLKQGEQRCLNARQEATNALVDIDDLEVLQSPESLLLSAVSGESQQDRTDRDMLAPWLKFVWESYKQCLDLLKNNNRVEKIYQEVAQMGFRFCQQYNRRPEFRKLCDTIRTHFNQSQKYSQQMYSVNFQLPETQVLHLETRLVQLDTAIAMELWQEAFKAVEDIHAFTTYSKKTPRPQQLATYYNKVALVFWKAGNFVFHATTVLKLYVLHKEQKKNITHAELARLSTKALLAILSIPLPAPRTQIDEHLETEESLNDKQKRLTSLLSLQQVPTRASLIRDMIKQGVLNFVHPELKDMYEWLEVEFHPLRLSAKMEEGIKFVEKLAQPEYSQYMPALRDVTVVRLLQQVSQVYQTIELKRFIALAPPIDQHRLEKIIVNAARNNDVQVRIEHKTQALAFGTDLSLSAGRSSGSLSSRVDAGGSNANVIQKMPNEQIRNQLISISRALHSCMELINEKANRERNDKLRQEIARTYHRDEPQQRKDMSKRRDLIERYKEDKEQAHKNKVKQDEAETRRRENVLNQEDEEKRRAEVQKRSEMAALEKKDEENRILMKAAIAKLRESDIGRKIIRLFGEEDLYKYDPTALNAMHIDAVIKDSRDQKEKLKIQHKKVDFLVRAMHEAEVPLLKKQAEDEMHTRREVQRNEREHAIERRERLMRMENDKTEFLQSIRGQRHDDYVEQMRDFEQRLTVERKRRLAQLREENKEKKKQDWIRQQVAKKERIKTEKERRIQEEKRRADEERLEKQRAIDRAKKEMFDRQAKIKEEREAAIERKLQQEREKEKEEERRLREKTTRSGSGTGGSPQEHEGSGKPWARRVAVPDDNRPPSHHVSDEPNRRDRTDGPRTRMGGDRRQDEPSSSKPTLNEPWRPKQRPEQQYRDDNREDRREERRPPPQHQQPSSEASSERWPDRSSAATSDNWRTVEKKREKPSRTGGDRPSHQRSDESALNDTWRPRRQGGEQVQQPRDEPRDNPRRSDGPDTWGRSEANNNWRSREKKRLNSWRGGNESDPENENERPRADGSGTGGGGGSSHGDRRSGGFGDDRRGGGFGDDRRSGGGGGGYSDDRRGGGSGYSDDRRGGGGGYNDDRRGGGFNDDRRGGGGSSFEDRRGGGAFSDDRRGSGSAFNDDRRGSGTRPDSNRRGPPRDGGSRE